MKHCQSLLLMLLAAMLVLGCSQDDTTTSGDIHFTDYSVYFLAATNNDATTRGQVMPAGEMNTSATFRVYATVQRRKGEGRDGGISSFINPGASSDANVVSYQQVDINAGLPSVNPNYKGVWKTVHDILWPDDIYFVDFYAVYPANAPIISDIVATRQLVYNNTTPMPGNYDLMYAKVLNARREGYGEFIKILPEFGPNSAVALQFHHALSRIMFYGKLSQQFKDFGWTVEVGGIRICNINAGGTLDFDASTPAITPAATPVLQNYTMTMNENRPVLDALTVKKDDAGEDIPLTSPTEITAVIPQNPTDWDPSTEKNGTSVSGPSTTGCYLAIQMKVKDAQEVYQMGSADSYQTVYVPFRAVDGGWQPAMTYNYTLTFGGGYDAAGYANVEVMTVTAAIQPWTSTTLDTEAKHKHTN